MTFGFAGAAVEDDNDLGLYVGDDVGTEVRATVGAAIGSLASLTSLGLPLLTLVTSSSLKSLV